MAPRPHPPGPSRRRVLGSGIGLLAAGSLSTWLPGCEPADRAQAPDLILHNGRIVTLDPARP
nr:hypothetical protein [Syntrophales bacterium]